MIDTPTPPDKSTGVQLSNEAIRERLRAATPKAIARLIELLDSKNPSVATGAAKIILAKVVPDLKATELSSPDGSAPTLVFTVMSTQAKEQLEKLYEGSRSTNS